MCSCFTSNKLPQITFKKQYKKLIIHLVGPRQLNLTQNGRTGIPTASCITQPSSPPGHQREPQHREIRYPFTACDTTLNSTPSPPPTIPAPSTPINTTTSQGLIANLLPNTVAATQNAPLDVVVGCSTIL